MLRDRFARGELVGQRLRDTEEARCHDGVARVLHHVRECAPVRGYHDDRMLRGVADADLDLDRFSGVECDRRYVQPGDDLGRITELRWPNQATPVAPAASKEDWNQGHGSTRADRAF